MKLIRFEKLVSYIKGLTTGRFFGKLVISFEAGKIVHVKREENVELYENN